MTRYLTGLIAAAGLILATASDAKAQVPVNPGAAQVAYARTNYAVVPVARHHGGARNHHRGYGYAPRAYAAPRFYGGLAPRHHHHRHCGHRGFGW